MSTPRFQPRWIQGATWSKRPSEPTEACTCGAEIVWTPSREAKDANDPNGPTHCCPAESRS